MSPFADIIHIETGRKYPKIIIEQNRFTINSMNNSRTNWRCSQYPKSKCKASLVTYGKIVKVNHSHNHPPTNPSVAELVPQTVTIIRSQSVEEPF
ncbi:unnamed protein product [Diabrotica balteata]|uniref:FLYWCH-type domain-containing protein n=1 Tax=Diabrotica balteata TaxID=107213 RepID=A0A9N9SZP2_DIABA|nr:unnamed protein product [Diabrotica balteata]